MMMRAATRVARAVSRAGASTTGTAAKCVASVTAMPSMNTAQPVHVTGVRCMSDINLPTTLSDILDREHELEKASYSGSNVVAELSQGFEDLGFTVSANPGFSTFYLNATTEQGEDMEIEVDATAVPLSAEAADDLDYQPEGAEENLPEPEGEGSEEEEGEEGSNFVEGFQMIVKVAKGDKELKFNCFASTHFVVDSVSFVEGSTQDDDAITGQDSHADELYRGPDFDDLDMAVQNAFYNYLDDRGINDDFSARIAEFCEAKEQTEYTRWLKNVRDFVI